MKIYIILNPVAGKGLAEEKLPKIKDLLYQYEIKAEIIKTQYPGHAISLAEELVEMGAGLIVAAGGDGTSNEVINGLVKAKKSGGKTASLGVLSVGRGNDFAYGAGIPGNLEEDVAILKDNYKVKIDIGEVIGGDYPLGRYFGNGIGIGFDTIVGLEAAKMKYVHGFMAYVWGAMKTLFLFFEAPLVKIVGEDQTLTEKTPQISIMNGRRMGGTFFMAPHALNNDGLLDICMTTDVHRRQMVSLISKYMKGTQENSPYITTHRGREYSIQAIEGHMITHADGETICTEGTDLEVKCHHQMLDIVCSPEKIFV
jgi:diacylglycerol kinase (ATP)